MDFEVLFAASRKLSFAARIDIYRMVHLKDN